jgi:hypothetical protein
MVVEHMKDNGLTELTVNEAVKIKVEGYMFCQLYGMGESGYCGKRWCKDYQPRNGKSGICKHQGSLYESGKEITIKIK